MSLFGLWRFCRSMPMLPGLVHFLFRFSSSHLPLAVLRFAKCVWIFSVYRANFLSCRQFASRNFFFFSFVLHYYIFLWFISSVGLCVNRFVEEHDDKKKQNKSTKFSLGRKPFICRHGPFSIWIAANNKKMSLTAWHKTHHWSLSAYH